MIYKTQVVNIRYCEYDVRITRGTPWGNPFVIGRDGSRQQVIERYRNWLLEQPDLVAKAQRELRGKRLGCVCAPADCHGDVLAEIADNARNFA